MSNRQPPPRDHSATYGAHTTLLRRHQGEQFELQCTCPHNTLQRVPKTPQSPGQHLRNAQEQSTNAPTVTIHRSPRLLRHVSLKKTVTAEDNEYEHIWQSSNNKGHRPPAPATANSDVIAEKSALSSPVSGSSLKSISKASRDVSCDSVLRKSTSASPTNQKAVDLPQTLPHYVTHKDIVSINATLSRSGKTKSPSSQDTLQKFSTFLQPSVQ